MKIEDDKPKVYRHDNSFDRWFEKAKINGVTGLTTINSDLLLRFIKDFSLGLNVSRQSKKGARSKETLIRVQQKIALIIKQLQERNVKDISLVDDRNLHQLFDDMRKGLLQSRHGKVYKSAGDYVKTFRVFWHWYQRIAKQDGKEVPDITMDLDRRGAKPIFIWITEEDFNKLLEHATLDIKAAMALGFDSGIRPQEIPYVKVSDFEFGDKITTLHIRDEISKTFGRKVKLMLSNQQLKEYIERLDLDKDDFFLQKSIKIINKELRQLGQKYLPKEKTKSKNLTFGDFRHSSACFWLPRYKSESALKYRFGWKKSDMIHYYTELLGMKDTITADDLYLDITKAELEKKLEIEIQARIALEAKFDTFLEATKIADEFFKDNKQIDVIAKGYKQFSDPFNKKLVGYKIVDGKKVIVARYKDGKMIKVVR